MINAPSSAKYTTFFLQCYVTSKGVCLATFLYIKYIDHSFESKLIFNSFKVQSSLTK